MNVNVALCRVGHADGGIESWYKSNDLFGNIVIVLVFGTPLCLRYDPFYSSSIANDSSRKRIQQQDGSNCATKLSARHSSSIQTYPGKQQSSH